LIPPVNYTITSLGVILWSRTETPEGHSVGVVKNLSYLTHITIPSNSDALNEYILPLVTPFELLTKEDWKGVKVFINGRWLGNTTNAMALYTSLKEKNTRVFLIFIRPLYLIYSEKKYEYVMMQDDSYDLFYV